MCVCILVFLGGKKTINQHFVRKKNKDPQLENVVVIKKMKKRYEIPIEQRKHIAEKLINKRRMVQCVLCQKFRHLVVQCIKSNHVPFIVDTFVHLKAKIINKHVCSNMHKEAMKEYERQNYIADKQLNVIPPVPRLLIAKNEAEYNHVAEIMIFVYAATKRCTFSPNNTPAMFVAHKMAQNFKFNDPNVPTVPSNLNLRYVNPIYFRIFQDCIIKAFMPEFRNIVDTFQACSIRCDGSVDRKNLDKIYHIAVIIDKNGNRKQYYVGMVTAEETGGLGYVKALEASLKMILGEKLALKVLNLVTSIVTDGNAANTGKEKGFWIQFQLKYRKNGSKIPLLFYHCCAHRSNLIWVKISKDVVAVKNIFQNIIDVASYFNRSAKKFKNLQEWAKRKNLKVRKLPPTFEIRWSEFSFDLLQALLVSWTAITTFLQEAASKDKDKTAQSLLHHLTKYETLLGLSFLHDLLFIFSR